MAGCFDELSTVDFRLIKERVMKAAVDAFGQLDLAFNNAGIQVPLSDAAVTSSVTATRWIV